MKKSILSTIALSAILCAGGLTLQSCADTRSETTYSTAPGYSYSTAPGYSYAGEPGYYANGAPVETTTTTTYTAPDDHDSVLGATAHAAGTIIAAPFRIVGDALGTIF